MLSDIEIAENCKMRDIREIAEKLGLCEDELELYGKYKAKIDIKKSSRSRSSFWLPQ